MSYDVIIVGARVAGAATGMLLANSGLRVLVADRAAFPSDTLSSHQLQPPGAERLHRWGLLEQIEARGTPAVRRVTFDAGAAVLRGQFPGGGALYSPRRTVLDSVLVDAARAAGAEVRERTIVEEIVASGGRVTGIRCREKGGSPVTETAALVIGADGKNSLVANAVRAPRYRDRPARSVAAYTYWQGVALDGGEMYGRDGRIVGCWPTNDDLAVTFLAWPASELAAFRADPGGAVVATLDLAGDLGERVRAGTRVGPVRATTDVPNFFRRPFGEGWALAGDAGLVMDPITGQGMGNALRDAEMLTGAVTAGLGGRVPLRQALRRYARRRDAETKAMFDFTVRLASFQPPGPEVELFAALADRPELTDRFFGTLAGSVPMPEFYSPRALASLVGWGGFARLARAQLRRPQPRAAAQRERATSVAQ